MLAGLICWYVLVEVVESQVWLAVCGDSASHGTGPVYTWQWYSQHQSSPQHSDRQWHTCPHSRLSRPSRLTPPHHGHQQPQSEPGLRQHCSLRGRGGGGEQSLSYINIIYHYYPHIIVILGNIFIKYFLPCLTHKKIRIGRSVGSQQSWKAGGAYQVLPSFYSYLSPLYLSNHNSISSEEIMKQRQGLEWCGLLGRKHLCCVWTA